MIEDDNIKQNPINFTKNQMKSTEQIKTLTKNEEEDKNTFQVKKILKKCLVVWMLDFTHLIL